MVHLSRSRLCRRDPALHTLTMRTGTRFGDVMKRERQEPTLGKQDMAEVHFRERSSSNSTYRNRPEIPWLGICLGVAAAVAIAMGLIEWSARRQAAAMTAELMRPMTKSEQAQFDREMARLNTELARDAEAIRPRTIRLSIPEDAPAPLRPGERCISGNRFRRIEGGWRDVPYEPC